MSGRYQKKCWGETLHQHNRISDGLRLIRGTHITPRTLLDALVEASGRTAVWVAKKKDRTLPYFCEGCINYYQDEQPPPPPPKVARFMVEEEELVASSVGVQTVGVAITVTDPTNPDGIGITVNELRRLSSEQRALLAFHLGQCERDNVRKGVMSWTWGMGRCLNAIVHCNPETYIEQVNPVLACFLHGLGTIPIPNNDTNIAKPPFPINKPSDIYKLCKVAEACASLTTPIAVLPFHFREVVLLYSLTRSRLALDVLASSSPSGCYSTVRSICSDDQGTIEIPKTGDILLAFDNNQVLKKTWRISLKCKFSSHVITMVVLFQIDENGELQTDETLKPSSWFSEEIIKSKLKKDSAKLKCLTNIDNSDSKARGLWYTEFIHPTISKYIREVASEHDVETDDKSYKDKVDKRVNEKFTTSVYKVCQSCGFDHVPIKSRKCGECGAGVSKSKQADPTLAPSYAKAENPRQGNSVKEVRAHVTVGSDDVFRVTYENVGDSKSSPENKYSDLDISDLHQGTQNKVLVQEPIFVNPCSYEALANVFRLIGKKAGIRQYCSDGTRAWVAIVCDGAPFSIGIRMIRKYYCCSMCETPVIGRQKCLDHVREKHPCWENEPENVHFYREFGWLLLLPGPGHIEMNMVKAYVKITWPVFWESLVEMFNFKTLAAKRVAMNVSRPP